MKLKKVLSLILCVAMVLSTMSFAVSADEATASVAPVEVTSYDELLAALAGDATTIVLLNDITGTATESNAYGKTGINILNGETLDGNGHALSIDGLYGTWDSAISITGGTIKNLTINKGFRGIFVNHNSSYSGAVIIDNVVIDGPTYAINCDQGTDKGITVKNSTIKGWTSYSKTIGDVEFDTCTFGKGAGYAYLVPYLGTTFKNCEFNEGFEIYTEATADNTLIFNDCTYDGEDFNANNITKLFDSEGNIANVVIDNEKIALNKQAVAYIGLTGYEKLADAIKAAVDGDTIYLIGEINEGSIKLPAVIKNLTIDGQGTAVVKNTTINAADGNSVDYQGFAVKNTTFDNSRFVLGGSRNGDVIYSNITFDNNKFLNIVNNGAMGAVHMQLAGDDNEYVENFTFTNNTVDGVSGSGNGVMIKQAKGTLVFDNNVFKNIANNALQLMYAKPETEDIIVSNNEFSEIGGGVINLYGTNIITIEDNNVFNLREGQKAVSYFTTAAKISNTSFATLQAAFNAAKDDDVIKLQGDLTITEDTRVHNSGNYYDGAYYLGDKSFTLDLNGYTLTHDGSVNDYLLNFKNMGEKANEITITNGTVDAGTNAYCAICTSSVSAQKMTINTENVTIIGNHSNGAVVKPRGYNTTANIKAGTKIIGKDSYAAIESTATVNIYEGAELYQNGTTSYLGAIIGVSGDGVANIYGGKGVSANSGIIAMSSGGTINVSGGEWTAMTTNRDQSILSAQNDKGPNGYPNGVDSIINVSGGKFNGYISAWTHGRDNEVAKVNITGGSFSVDPAAYVAKDSDVEVVKLGDDEGYKYPYIIAPKAASAIKVELAETDTDGVYDIVLISEDGYDIHEFVAAEFTFKNDSTTVGGSIMQYEILGLTEGDKVLTVAEQASKDEFNNEQYIINVPDGAKRLTSEQNWFEGNIVEMLKIGQVKFIGQGTINFEVTNAEVDTTWQNTNLGRYYYSNDGTLNIAEANIENGSVADITRDVAVKVTYNHDLVTNVWANNKITVTLKDGFGEIIETKDVDGDSIADGLATFEDVRIGRITVTLEAPGFRKFVYETTLEEGDSALVLNFWNDVKKDAYKLPIEAGKTPVTHNFVVGDIVMDYIVDKYDLAAVTSYYGMYDIENNSKYLKYDLNRDGNIDIRDVQYVLHTMGN